MIRQSKSLLLQLFAPVQTEPIDAMKQQFNAHKHAASNELDEIERLTHRLCEADSQDNSTIFFAYDGNYHIQHVSDQVPQILGYRSEELLGTSILDHMNCGSNIASDLMQGLIEGTDFTDNEIQMATKEGKSIWVKLSGFLVKDTNHNLSKGIVFGVLL